MAISLQNILRFAESNNSIPLNHPDGTTSIISFNQRSLDYGDNPPLVIKDLPKVDQETNGALGLVNQITGNLLLLMT